MDYEVLIEKAKSEIEQDLKKIGIANDTSKLEVYLIVAAFKAIGLSDSIIYLCDGDFNNESLIILRSLIEHSINMRWIMNKNTKDRLRRYRAELGIISFGKGWANLSLDKRMEEIGFSNKDYFDFVVKFTYDNAHVNISSLTPEIIKRLNVEGVKYNFSSQAIYSVVAQMLGHVLQALNVHFKDFFNGYKEIWQQVPVRLKARESFEKKIKEFKRLKINKGV